MLGPGQDGKKIAPEGLKVSGMNAAQQAMLLDVIAEWAGIMNENSAAARMAELQGRSERKRGLHGAAPQPAMRERTSRAYYRIQGPHLVIEYAPQNDEPTNHVHTMYRDPTNDYGRALTVK